MHLNLATSAILRLRWTFPAVIDGSPFPALVLQELEFANLTAVLHCIHSFIAAKVASMDPLFMYTQSFHGSHVNS